MAIYHLQVRTISRGNGSSAIAAAAYRSGDRLFSYEDNRAKNYLAKQDEIQHSEIYLPTNAPDKFKDRETLWNAVQEKENKINSRFAREIIVALPVELTKVENIRLLEQYTKENFVDRGMIADVNFHDKKDGNPHAHIMLTTRPLDERGEWADKQKKVYKLDANGNKIYDAKKKTYKCHTEKTVDWDDKKTLESWRENWSEAVNHELEQKGLTERISHLSYEAQGIDKIPTTHLGRKVDSLEKKGIQTERGNINRLAEKTNNHFATQEQAIYKELAQLEGEKKEFRRYLETVDNPVIINMQNYNRQLDRDIQKQDYKQPADYRQRLDIFKKASSEYIGVYLKGRTDYHELALSEEVERRKEKRLQETDQKLAEVGKEWKELQQNKPFSFWKFGKDDLNRWEMQKRGLYWQAKDCEEYKEKLNTPQWSKDEMRSCNFDLSQVDEVENRELGKLEPEQVKIYLEGKILYHLRAEIEHKTDSLTKHLERDLIKEREREKDRGLEL